MHHDVPTTYEARNQRFSNSSHSMIPLSSRQREEYGFSVLRSLVRESSLYMYSVPHSVSEAEILPSFCIKLKKKSLSFVPRIVWSYLPWGPSHIHPISKAGCLPWYIFLFSYLLHGCGTLSPCGVGVSPGPRPPFIFIIPVLFKKC